MTTTTMYTPIGLLELSAHGGQLTAIDFVDGAPDPAASPRTAGTPRDLAVSPPPALDAEPAAPAATVATALPETAHHSDTDEAVLQRAVQQLTEYFQGERVRFDLPLAPAGTPFQRRVWTALLEIPYGETWSYGELARRIGAPTSSRAVGAANGRNPLPVVIPCHRVIGANGTLVGYGGGMERKKTLLSLEARVRLAHDFG